MIELLKILLSLSLSGTLLILVLLLCKPLIKNKLSKQWQYYIWLIVIARLLFPFTTETNLMGILFQNIDNAVMQVNTAPTQNNIEMLKTDFTQNDNYTDNQTITSNLKPEKLLFKSVFNIIIQNIWLVCWFIWLMVTTVLLIRKITIYQSFVKYIKAGQIEVSDMKRWEQLGKLVTQTGAKKAVGLYTNSLISSPLLIGFFHPCIMLPSTELSDSDFEYTILHELTHYKRRDMFYKWLVQITICFHWFNPFVYLIGREINCACELSCDESVIRKLDDKGKRAYGDTLLNAIRVGGKYEDYLASMTLNESKELLKERLDAIMKFKKKTRLTTAISIALIFTLSFGSTVVGAYAITPESTSQLNNKDTTKMDFHTTKYYFENNYIIKMKWNVNINEYPKTAKLDASGNNYTVAFSENTSSYVENSNVIKAIKLSLSSHIKFYQDNGYSWMDIVTPAITEISGPYNQSSDNLAYKFYQENNLNYFRAVLPNIQLNVIKDLYEKAYKDNNTVFFNELLSYIPNNEKKYILPNNATDNSEVFRSLIHELPTD
ncbi:M56 family metallopeptidase [Clostridioides difficile]|nr:M56 family metallopeptidase [Clostridioides difficile]